MEPREEAYLKGLCRILDIPFQSTEENPSLALNVLTRMYLVPTIKEHSKRNRAVNEIRANLSGQFSNYSVFTGRTARLAVQMQEFPYWFDHLNAKTKVLISQYKNLELAVSVLGKIGIGAGAGALVAGGVEASKSGSLKQGAKVMTERLVGRGPAIKEAQRRLGLRFSPKAAGVAGAVVIIGGTLIYYSALERMEDIRAVLMHRFQKGELTDDQYREVFGDTIDPDTIKRYWEM